MQEKEQNYWLALCRAPILGPINQRRLLEKFGGKPEQLFAADRRKLKQHGLKSKTLNYFRSPDWQAIESDLAWLEQPYHHMVTILRNLMMTISIC
jgi:DNA processing protein